MEFVNPGFLYGLLAVAVPVIIHLFNFRRFKKVYFTNVAFIKELKQETQKQSRFKHLLVLLMRMLAIAAIVMAFARPFIPAENNLINPDSQNLVSIYLDNSFSMEAESEQGTMLDAARSKAAEIASVYGNADRFQLLTNEFGSSSQRFINREEFLDALDEVAIAPSSRSLDEIMQRQDQLLKLAGKGNKTAYIVSDFQQNMLKNKIPETDSLTRFLLVQMEAVNADNLYIDSCWFDAPVQQVRQSSMLHVRFKNGSGGDYERVPVSLTLNGIQKAVTSLDIGAGGEKEIELTFTNAEPGLQYGQVSISDYPITFDDQLYFTFPVSQKVKIYCINGDGANPYLNALFAADTAFNYQVVPEQSVDYASLSGKNLILLNELQSISSGMRQELVRFVENGGSLVVLPARESIDLNSYNSLLRALSAGAYKSLDTMNAGINHINLEHSIYSGVFDEIPENINLPEVFNHYPIQLASQQIHDKLLELENGDIFLNVQPFGEGKVYLFAAPVNADFSTFPRHALFVPTLYNIAISSITPPPLYYTNGRDEMIRITHIEPVGDEVFYVRQKEGAYEFIPEQRKVNSGIELYPHGQAEQAGFYELLNNNEIIRGLAFNYDRLESDMRFADADALEKFVVESGLSHIQILKNDNRPFVQTLTDLSQGKQLWKWFVLAALLFLLLESTLLRLLK